MKEIKNLQNQLNDMNFLVHIKYTVITSISEHSP